MSSTNSVSRNNIELTADNATAFLKNKWAINFLVQTQRIFSGVLTSKSPNGVARFNAKELH
jgi:hypothetical protein